MKSFLAALLFLTPGYVLAQNDEKDVKHTLEKLFAAMNQGDSASASVLFTFNARLQSVFKLKSGEIKIEEETVTEFMKQIGSKKPDESYDERIKNYEIRVDGELATAWTPYEFYYNGNFSHSGVNAFQLVKLDGKWKILQITDTRRKAIK